ncbi:MAG: NosD domain-containing protein [Candidatus Lokiarchaeia archaeon]
MESSSDILLSGNTAANNSYGFYLRSSSSNNLTGNIAVNNSNYGFHILFGSNNLLSGNNATNNNNYGFFLNSSSKNILSSNVATNNLNTGFYLEKSSNNLLSINIAINNNNYGFYLNSSLNNSLTGNTATNNFNGFYLLGSDNNTLIYNNATHNTNYGYRLQNSSSNIITGNTALNCTTGYYWTDSSNNDFTGSVEENWLRVNVMNVLGLPFPSVDVRVETDGISVYATPWFGGLDSVTDPTGFIPWITVIHKTGTGIDTMTENITTVTVRYSTPWTVVSFSNNPRIVDMSTSHIETFRQQYVNVAWINPVITDVNVLQYFNITINGDLTITETGELHLINCILNLNNGTTPVEYGVKVYGGMYINESSTITAINPVNPYYFTVYEGASFQMNNSRVEYCGHENGLWPDQQGLIVRADNAWIENNTITQCWNGLILYGSNGSIILNNNATDNTENGFALFNFADNNLLSGNMAANNAQYGFYLNRSYYNTLSGNMAANNAQYGFYLNYSSYNGLSGNIAINNTCGFYLWFAFENLLSGNIAINNAEQGFYLRYVGGDNTFTNNTATNNHIGFSVDYTNNNTFTNNIANNNTYGFFITLHSDANKLYNNTALNNHNGFYLEGGSNNIFTNNTAANNTRGFYFNNTESNTLTNNVAANNTYGFFLNYSEANNLTGNTALNNQYGFYLLESSNKNIISGNFATNNYHGFYLNASSYNTLVSNTATNNGDQGFVLISNSNNNLLSGNTATNNGYGFSLYSSSYNNLTSNTATNNYYGFYLVDGSNNNLLSGNTATNSTYYGFYLRNNANNNLLLNNTATYNIRGFYLYESSNNNNLSGNTATNNGDGFYLYLSSFNNLAGNIAVNNEYGFYLYSGSNNNLLSDNIATENIYGFKLHKTSYNTIVNNTALNCTTGYYWTDSSNNDFTGSVEENWLRVNVIYVLDVPLPGVDVQVVTDGTPVYATPWFGGSDPVTDQNGLIPWITVTYKTGTGIDSITKNITTVTVRYPTQWTEATFPNNPRIVDMSTSHLETFRQQYVNVTWINPVITEVNVLQYFNITIKGNLTIESGGELHLINCILNLNNGTTPVEYGVKVYGGMYINESSTISPINPANPYFFTVYEGASFQMNDSRVEYCGDGSGSFPDEWGLAVRTDNAWIKNNTLTHGRSGLILYGSQGSTILNNNITNNTGAYGLWLHNSWYNNLTGNTATNHWLGIRLINSSYNTLTGNTATNNTYGFILEDNPNNNNLVGNTATGNTYGFYLYYNSNNNKITDNTAINNIYGFMLLSGSNNNTLKDNIAINCSTGYNWSSNSINNDFTGSVWLNYLRLNITDSLGLPIPGVDVMVETDGVQVYATPHFAGSDPRTDQNGLTSWIVVPYKIFTGNDTMTENTVTVTVWNSTAFFLNNSRTVSMSMSHVEIFILDNLPPTVTITSPDNGAFIPTTDVEVTWTGYDLSGIDHYEVRLDSGNWINVGISTSHTFTNLSKDFHTVYVRAFDKAGYNTLDSVSFAVGPDFAIFTENISLEKIGGITYIYATVTNLGGDYMGPIEVIFLDKDEYGNIIIGVQIIENLLHDESKTVSVEWKLNQFHTVIVMVDPDSGIEELNETNNVAQKYIYDYRPIIQNVSSEFGVWEDSDSVGTFITEIEVINTFRVLVSDRDGADDIVRVVFKLNGKTYDATRHGSSWKCELDMGDLNPTVEPIKQNILEITAYDKAGLISDTRIVTIRAIDASPWASFFSSLDYTTEWDSINQKYLLKGTIPIFGELKLDYSVKIPKEIPKVGNKPVGVYLELSAEIVYYVNGSAKASQITGMGVNWLGSEYGRKMEVTYLDLNDDLSFDYYILKDTHKFPIPYSWKIPDGYLYLPDPFLGGTFSPEFGLYLDGEISYEIRFEMIDTEINIISLSVDLGFHGGGKLRQRWPILLVVWPAIMEIDAYAYTNMHAVFTFTDYGNYYSFYGDPGIGVYCDCRLWIWTIQGWEDYGIIRTPEIELPFLLGTLGTSSLGQVNPLMAEEPRSVALENAISVDSSPRVAADAYGNAMVIWVQGRVDGNNTYSDICYATWNGTDWSTSGFISYDEHCDFDPALTYDSNGNVIAVWSRILYDPPLYSPDDPLSLFKNQEIVYSLWDGSTWSIPQPITNDTFSDGTAAVTAGPDGTVIAVWVGYTEADFSTPIDTNLYYSVWDGAQWTPKTPLTNNTFMDYSVSLAHDSKGNAIACWVRDLDGNISTSFDTELRYAMWDGTSWSPSGLITGLNETIESPSVTFDLNDNALVTWVGGDEIANRLYFASWDKTTGSWSEPEIVHEADFFIYNPVINVDPDNTAMIIWRGFDDEAEEPTYYVNNIISTYFDGEICYAAKNLSRPDSSWSEIKFLTSDNETDWMASAVTIPGHSYDLLLVWDKEGIMSNLTHPIKPDLILDSSDITFSNNYPSAGETIDITARISNIGDVEAYNISVEFYDGDPSDGGDFIGTQLIDYLNYNSEVYVTLTWVAEAGAHNIYVVIDPLGSISELDETNNIAYNTICTLPDLFVYPTDIAFSNSNPLVGEQITIYATINNQGGTYAENVLVQFYANDIQIGSQTISSIDANGYAKVSMDWTATAGYNKITIVVDSINLIVEWNEENNIASTSISILPDLEVNETSLSDKELMPGENVSIATEIRNLGSADAIGVLVEFFDGNPYINGTLIYSETIDLTIGGTHTSAFVWTPPLGIHQVFVMVDRQNLIAESNETNNIQYDELVVRIVPDLTILESEITYESGSIKIIVPVENIGEAGATGVVVGLYDGDPATGGAMLDGETILHIPAGGTANFSLILYETPKSGFLYIVVDPGNMIMESNETNNKVAISYETIILVDAGPDQVVDEGDLVEFSAWVLLPGDIADYTFTWDFGDGTTGEGVNTTHRYGDNGEYTVTITVYSDGVIGTDQMKVTVQNVAPTVDAGPDQTVDEGTPLNFNANLTDPGFLDTHTISWTFGDGSTTTGTLTPTHTYVDNGIYTVILTVTDDDGETSTDTLKVIVNNVAPTVDVGLDQTVNEDETVSFSPIVTDPGSDTFAYSWDFDGDGVTDSTLENPTHVYTKTGTYTVTLTVTDDDGGVGMDSLTVRVLNVPPVADAGPDQAVDENQEIIFNASNSWDTPSDLPTLTYNWNFGDGNMGTGLVVSHMYEDSGTYTVTLTVTDDDGAVGTDTCVVTVLDKTPPTTELIIGPHYVDQAGNIYVTSTTDFTLIASDAFSGVAHTYYRINDGEWIEYVSPFNITGPIGNYTIEYYSVDNAGNEETPKSETIILEEAYHGHGMLRIDKQWFRGDATLFLSENLIRIQIDDQIATWNIVKHCQKGNIDIYFGEGELGKIVLIIHRGEISTHVLAAGRGVFFCGHT